jgi:arylsulfatase A-like enzyme
VLRLFTRNQRRTVVLFILLLNGIPLWAAVSSQKLASETLWCYKTRDVFPSRYELRHSVEKNDFLSFSYGVDPKSRPLSQTTHQFLIEATADGKPIVLFTKVLSPKSKPEDGGWQDAEIDLASLEGKNVHFEFKASSASIWGGIRVGHFNRQPGQFSIILISLDTLRWDHMSVAGYPRKTTPYLDKLATQSVYFDDAISVAPWTKPSHFSVFTGLFPSYHQMTRFDRKKGTWQVLNQNIPTLTEILKQNGYRTQAYTGSGNLAGEYGYARGFDRYDEVKNPHRDGDFVFGNGLEWIRKNRKRRFFLFLHTYEIHAPYGHTQFLDPDQPVSASKLSPRERIEKQILRYDSGIYYADSWIGRLENTLKESGLNDKVLVIVFSDHGEELMQRKLNMGHGQSLYDELLRVPLIFYFPSRFPPRKIADYQAQQTDLMPTILDTAGIRWDNLGLQGHSLVPILKGGAVPESSLAFSESPLLGPSLKSVRYAHQGIWKYILAPDFCTTTKAPPAPYQDERLPLSAPAWITRLRESNGEELYSISKDPLQTRNQIGKGNNMEERLRKTLADYMSKTPTQVGFGQLKRSGSKIDDDQAEKLKSLGY